MRLKPKFRPNLPVAASRGVAAARVRKVSGSEGPAAAALAAARARKISGSEATATAAIANKRIRTTSGSSNGSAKEIVQDQQPKQNQEVTETRPSPYQVSSPLAAPTPPPPPQTITAAALSSSPILKSALQGSPELELARNTSSSSSMVIRCSLDSTQSLSPNFMHSPPPRPIGRQRRLTETSNGRTVELMGCSQVTTSSSVYDRRKADHKRKFNAGVPERKRMTMFDLIYYNPTEGTRMSNSSSRRGSRASSVSEEGAATAAAQAQAVPERLAAVKERLEEEMVDDVASEGGGDEAQKPEGEDEVDEAMPVPQVKVGPNGEIVVDEESTVIETSRSKKAKDDILKAPLVFESANQTASNYGSWGKKRKNVDWTDRETVRFYKALSVFGTDFSMMESVFKRRSRHDLKMKFKREERGSRALVDKHLREGMLFDPAVFQDEDTDEDEEVENRQSERKRKRREPASAAAKKRKRKSKKSVSSRGYYSSSDADAELSEHNEVSSVAEGGTPRRRSARRSSSIQHPSQPFPTTIAQELETLTEVIQIDKEDENDNVTTTTAATANTSRRQPRGGPVPNLTQQGNIRVESSPLLKNLLQHQQETSVEDDNSAAAESEQMVPPRIIVPAPAFPPGLLAANPGLANAVPGSLVVVASPSVVQCPTSSSSATEQQVLHVFRVTESTGKL